MVEECSQLGLGVWQTSGSACILTAAGAKQVLDCSSLAGESGAMGANGRAQISTFCARHNLLAAGGFAGELDVAHIHRPGLLCRWPCWRDRLCLLHANMCGRRRLAPQERQMFRALKLCGTPLLCSLLIA